MKLLAIALFGLALVVPAFARIGETLEQAKQRYGEIEGEDEFMGLRRIEFEKNEFRVITIFVGDRIGAIHFVKLPTGQYRGSEEMSEVEIKNFLKFNGGGKQWKQVAERTWTVPGLTAWHLAASSQMAAPGERSSKGLGRAQPSDEQSVGCGGAGQERTGWE